VAAPETGLDATLKMKKMKRKCHTCGKMATDPYTFSVVPTHNVFETIPPYSKAAKKVARSEVKEIITHNYCNRECYENRLQEK
jgi:hypothetical protein|tara:strand:+ start:1098 stop:1346 length:249 start_codon:yes stop_codon:yes gene_type:complete